MILHWTDPPPNERKRDDGAVFQLGDLVKVKDQEIHGKIVRWDGGKAVVLDDDDGTLVFSLSELVKW